MGRAKERWWPALLLFVAAWGVFTLSMMRARHKVASEELLNGGRGKPAGGGEVLYNYHSFEPETGTVNRGEESETVGATNGKDTLEPTNFIYHEVREGDSLWRIARSYGADIGEIQRWNRIRDPNVIYVGSVIKIRLKSS